MNSTEPTTARAPRRAVLALIALAELPMPNTVNFHSGGEILGLDFDRLAEGQAWSAHLGGKTDTYVYHGRIYLSEGLIDWQGWRVQLHVSEPAAPDIDLDADSRAQLGKVASGCRG